VEQRYVVGWGSPGYLPDVIMEVDTPLQGVLVLLDEVGFRWDAEFLGSDGDDESEADARWQPVYTGLLRDLDRESNEDTSRGWVLAHSPDQDTAFWVDWAE
jgi:hypothetical protein